MAAILLCGVDLFMRGKLEALLPGHRLITVDHTEDPDLVLADVSRIDPEEVADTYPDIPIVGFTNHTDTSGLRAAIFWRLSIRSPAARGACCGLRPGAREIGARRAAWGARHGARRIS